MWKFLRVDISDVVSSVDRSNFSETELETLANLIVEMEGLMRPAILKKAGFEKGYDRFQLISGDLEYHASVLAKQKNPDIEMINAFVVDPESENIAIRQLQALSETVVNSVLPEKTEEEKDETEEIDPKYLDIERRFQEFQVAIEQKIKFLEDRHERDIQQLRKEYQEAISSSEPKIAKKPDPEPPSTSKPTILEVLNTYSEKQLASMGFSKTIAQTILVERAKKPLESFGDLKSRIKAGWKIENLVKFIDAYDSL